MLIESSSTAQVLQAASALANPEERGAAARALARVIGTDDLIIFVRDDRVGQSLPAPGFPQTLQGGRVWRSIVDLAIRDESADGRVSLRGGEIHNASAIGNSDGTVAVLIGGKAKAVEVEALRSLLPIMGALFRMEADVRRAQGNLAVARQSAEAAAELAAKLDAARADLQGAVSIAETATRARDDFLATMSHELRTPLTSIIGWVQLLREEQDPVLIREALETIDRNARSQSRLIEDILDFSRINAGKLRLDIRSVDPAVFVTAALDVLRPTAEAKGVELDTIIAADSGPVFGDPDRLQQVVWNLIANAVKFTPAGGKVTVRAEQADGQCRITVADSGEGISPEFLPFVFDRFSQADSSSTRQHGGLGLGLGIVKHLVELHGGNVQAFSGGVKKGATFVVRLSKVAPPLEPGTVAHKSETVRAAATREGLADLTGRSVLVLEDNDDARNMLAAVLRRSGASVEAADSVAGALRLFGAKQPDIIVSDIEMPVEDGYSFISKIRMRESPDKHVPAIALTAYSSSTDRVRALAAGFQLHMTKPVDPTDLVAAIRSLLTAEPPHRT
jgi:signal transduction histidine kinase/CheY-like chemotaxis protein